ncbi:MAG: hypothetical protein L0154_27985 [Chloroflexi bacterium]|nr:hypothetical protein [Chloroflexota bacterium]
MAPQRRILKPEEEISHAELMEERRRYTDQQARQLGYPSAEVLHLSDRLSEIAGQWRTTKDNNLVIEYRQILYEMILKGYDVNTLPVQDQLPEELMPNSPHQQFAPPLYRHMKNWYPETIGLPMQFSEIRKWTACMLPRYSGVFRRDAQRGVR